VAKVGTSKEGGTISQQAAVHPWLAAGAHGNKLTNKQTLSIQADISFMFSMAFINIHFVLCAIKEFDSARPQ
jgi:hypothetical protein